MTVSHETPFALEFLGRPAGRGCLRLGDCGWSWGWERPDGTVHAAGPFDSEQQAGDALMLAAVAHYEAMQ